MSRNRTRAALATHGEKQGSGRPDEPQDSGVDSGCECPAERRSGPVAPLAHDHDHHHEGVHHLAGEHHHGHGAHEHPHAHDDHGHAHGHGHGHHHAHFTSRTRTEAERKSDMRRLGATLALTAGVMVAEAVGGWVSGSLALLSDAGHMLTDLVSLLLALVALWFSGRPADLKRTYGFYRLEILAALANGVALFLIAGVVAYEAAIRIQNPEPLRIGIMLVVASIGLAVNLGGMALLAKSNSMNVRAAFLHVIGDALSSFGVIVAGLIAWFTGYTVVDPIVSIIIAAVIVIGALGVVREAVDVLLEAVPSHIDMAEVVDALKKVEGVAAVHDLHVWTIANSMHALSAHLVVRSDGGMVNNDAILGRVRTVVQKRFGIDHTTLQIESEHYGSLAETH